MQNCSDNNELMRLVWRLLCRAPFKYSGRETNEVMKFVFRDFSVLREEIDAKTFRFQLKKATWSIEYTVTTRENAGAVHVGEWDNGDAAYGFEVVVSDDVDAIFRDVMHAYLKLKQHEQRR